LISGTQPDSHRIGAPSNFILTDRLLSADFVEKPHSLEAAIAGRGEFWIEKI
jgi:hypothetical protein